MLIFVIHAVYLHDSTSTTRNTYDPCTPSPSVFAAHRKSFFDDDSDENDHGHGDDIDNTKNEIDVAAR